MYSPSSPLVLLIRLLSAASLAWLVPLFSSKQRQLSDTCRFTAASVVVPVGSQRRREDWLLSPVLAASSDRHVGVVNGLSTR